VGVATREAAVVDPPPRPPDPVGGRLSPTRGEGTEAPRVEPEEESSPFTPPRAPAARDPESELRSSRPPPGEGEEEPPARGVLLPPRFDEPRGKFADSPYFFVPA
jgi:hypothetical protein